MAEEVSPVDSTPKRGKVVASLSNYFEQRRGPKVTQQGTEPEHIGPGPHRRETCRRGWH